MLNMLSSYIFLNNLLFVDAYVQVHFWKKSKIYDVTVLMLQVSWKHWYFLTLLCICNMLILDQIYDYLCIFPSKFIPKNNIRLCSWMTNIQILYKYIILLENHNIMAMYHVSIYPWADIQKWMCTWIYTCLYIKMEEYYN